jgi:RHS repeat-associated protein
MAWAIAALMLFCCTAPGLGAEDDKNGVSPNTISLPSGPGSIEGLGEAFQPMLNTGSARYAVKIPLPAGTAGHAPSLSLSYESGLGDGPAGIGWKFGPGSIRRQTEKGLPRYVDGPNGVDDDGDGRIDEADEPDQFIGLEGEELVQLSDGTFRPRIEGAFIRYQRVKGDTHDHFVAHLKDGTELVFGSAAQAMVTDETGAKIYKWLLEKSTDTNGNVIEFYYTDLGLADNQKYLKEIRYGPGAPDPESGWPAFYFAGFSYEVRPDWRTDYRSGFMIRTDRRLKQIDIGIQGVLPDQCAQGDWNGDGVADALISRYVMDYDDTTSRSYLARVTRFGSDGVSYLPPISFSYSLFDPEPVVSAAGRVITSDNAPAAVVDNELVDFIDLNRDGLPDILKTDLYGGAHTGYINKGLKQENDLAFIVWDYGRTVSSPYGLAAQLHLAGNRVHLADMDGNGISDLIHTTNANEVFYHLNQGDGSWGQRKRMSVQDTAPPAPFTDDDVKTSDLDFNKRIDVIRSTQSGYAIWFNLEEGKYSRETRTNGARYGGVVIGFSRTGVLLADINGDRLSDVVWIRPTHVIVCAGRGYGHFEDGVQIPIPDAVLTDYGNSQIKRARLEDINGDGLADLVVERAVANELWYWLNLGTYRFSDKHVITHMPSNFSFNTAVRWADINGNGTTDLIYADSYNTSRIRAVDIGEMAGGSAHANLLTGIDNGLGVNTEIVYQSSTEFCNRAREAGAPWTSTVPFPVSVISAVWTTTGLDLDTVPGDDQYLKEYIYRNGYYEDREKAFRGFETVRVVEYGDVTAPTSVSTHRFYTGGPDGADNDDDSQIDEISPEGFREEEALKGMVRSLEIRDENNLLFSREENDWRLRNLASSVDDVEVRFAYNKMSDKLIYEGRDTPETIRTYFDYDDFGNVTQEKREGAISISGDELYTYTEYINNTDLWLIGIPMRQHQTGADDLKVSEVFSYYDGAPYKGLALGQVEKGNLTRRQGWVQDSTYVELLRNAYDDYGNITGIMDGNGHIRRIAWDPIVRAFPVQEDIPVGGGQPDLGIGVDYHPGLGTITKATDYNGHDTHFAYDCFGRLTKIVRPGDTLDLPTLRFSYTMADPAKEVVYAYTDSGRLDLFSGIKTPSAVSTYAREVSGQYGTYDTVQYSDGMGRKLALVEEGESGFVVNEAVLFNAKGSPLFGFLPYESNTRGFSAPDPLSGTKTENHYDAAGRPARTINPPDKDGQITETGVSYAPLTKTVTDENTVSKTFGSDGLERLVQVEEENRGETCITRYAYDPTGNLTRITDAQNNINTMAYDGLGRRTTMDDPDRGHMDYRYDPAGNLSQTTDNKSQVIQYTYDHANRLLTEDFLDSAGITPDVTYHYDLPSTDYPGAANLKGRPAWIEDLSGGQFFSYDDRGNHEWTVRRINTRAGPQDFETRLAHDALGRVQSMIYPDGYRAAYTYNNRSLLESVPGVINNIDYFVTGLIESMTCANGVETTYAYDPRQRLKQVRTISTFQAGAVIQDLNYTLDGVGNIKSIADGRNVPADSPQNASQSFEYDDLYRLTHAEGAGYGAIDFQYDKIGNMIRKQSPDAPDPGHIDDPLINLGVMTVGGALGAGNRTGRLPGDPPGPHAITATASGLAYDYDDNGNMVSHAEGDIYTWDFKDRLLRVQKGDIDTAYTYDHSGQRVTKTVTEQSAQKTTLYIGKAYEIREGQAIKYLFSGSRRVARIEKKEPQTGPTRQTLNFEPGWNFFSLDVAPDNPAIDEVLAAIAGNCTQVWTYDAGTQQYVGHVPSESISDLTELRARTGYLINVTASAALTVTGTPDMNAVDLFSGWNLISCPSNTSIPLTKALGSIDGDYASVWYFDTANHCWQSYTPKEKAFLNDLGLMHPGRAYWIRMDKDAQVDFQQPGNIYFYHPDHLGSSSVVTDLTGTVVERTEFYPFGRPRYEERTSFQSAFKYTGKELDKESGLMYYEARYYDPTVGRFLSADKFYSDNFARHIQNVRTLNPYVYCFGNPIGYFDPDGKSFTSWLFSILTKAMAKISRKKATKITIKKPWVHTVEDPAKASNNFNAIKEVEIAIGKAEGRRGLSVVGKQADKVALQLQRGSVHGMKIEALQSALFLPSGGTAIIAALIGVKAKKRIRDLIGGGAAIWVALTPKESEAAGFYQVKIDKQGIQIHSKMEIPKVAPEDVATLPLNIVGSIITMNTRTYSKITTITPDGTVRSGSGDGYYIQGKIDMSVFQDSSE